MQCPTHKRELSKLQSLESGKRCEMCGREAALFCKSCKFVLCGGCRICDKRHFLVKMIDLCKVNSEYYSNSYSCNTCKKSKVSDDDGLWHCSNCNYDVCPDCVD